MLIAFFDRLRQKPRHVRRRFVLLVSCGVTLLLAIIWIFTLPARFADIDVRDGLSDTTEFDDAQRTFDTTGNSIKNIFNQSTTTPDENGAGEQASSTSGDPDTSFETQDYSQREVDDGTFKTAPDGATSTEEGR